MVIYNGYKFAAIWCFYYYFNSQHGEIALFIEIPQIMVLELPISLSNEMLTKSYYFISRKIPIAWFPNQECSSYFLLPKSNKEIHT